jgi:two-component system LytT family response regulator
VVKYPELLALERNKNIVLLPVKQIEVIQGAGDYVEIETSDGDFIKRESLTNMINIHDPISFQRVHRSAIVQVKTIE